MKRKLCSTALAVVSGFFAFSQQAIPVQGTTPKSPPPVTNISVSGSLNQTPAQSGQHTCASHELTRKYYQQAGLLHQFNQESMQAAMNTPAYPLKTSGVNEISVIFHVVYNPNNPAENVSNALIMQVFQDLTEDYQLLNADAANARTGAPFSYVPADANINFCLATQDPNGNPLTELGVVRVATTEDYYNINGEENKMKSSATGGSDIWDRNRYLNVWICDISNGAGAGVAGYAFRPSPSLLPSASIDGVVLDYNLGMNNDNVLTHEVGHYLGLDHTWGGTGGCGQDDGFSDTPVTAGPSNQNSTNDYQNSCSGSQQTCPGTETQYENYMDYANCTCMFTQMQANYMLSILTGVRSSLLLSPGCDPTNTPPNSAFASIPAGPAPVIIPANGSVNFIDQSTNVPTGWLWTISGTQGVDWNWINSTNQSSQDPQAEFYTPGLYDVSLTASNAYGTDPTPAIGIGYVQVAAPASGIGCDTLRNWNTGAGAGPITWNAPAAGYAHGNATFTGPSENALQWAEIYTATSVTSVRGVEFAPYKAVGTGNVVWRVYADNAGVPGTVLASTTVALSDLTEGAWNHIDIVPAATGIVGDFWVGYQLSYNAGDTFALYAQITSGANNTTSWQGSVTGWEDIATTTGGAAGINGLIDVLTSAGPDPAMDFTATDDQVCVGGSITVNGSGSTNNADYRWYVTDDPISTVLETSTTAGNTFTFPYAAGDYAIYLFGDGSCMSDGVYLPVTVFNPVAATVTPTATTCGNNNGVITVTAPSGGDGTYYYSLDGVNYQTGNTFSNLAAGNYTVYVATLGDNCEATYSVTVGSSAPASASASASQGICPGGNATITASGGISYVWSDGATVLGNTASINVSPTATTQYACLVTNAGGCQTTVYTTVNVFTSPVTPVITASGATTICSGSSVDLSSSYASGNTWSTTETSSTITVSTAGNYTVTYTDGNGCTSTSTPVSVVVNASPAISSGTVNDPSACSTATGSIQVTGPAGTGTVNWSGTASGSSGGGASLPYTIPTLAAGSYNITFTDANGCVSNTLSQALQDPTPPATPIITNGGPTTFCAGGSVTLTSSYGSGNTWSNSAVTNSIVVTTSGSYSVTYTDGSGCSSTSSPVVVTVNSNPATPTVSTSGPTTFCDGGSVILTSSQGSGNTWSNSATSQSITVTTTGSYSVTYTNANGCSSTSAPVNVTVNSNPAAPVISPAGSVAVCSGTTVTLSATPSTGIVWSNSQTTPSITVGTTGNYSVIYTDANGCSATSAVTAVTVNSLPAINAGPDQTVCEGSSVTLTGTGGASYAWDNGVSDGVAFTPVAGTLTYTVTGTDANGCVNTDQVSVTVNALPAVSFGALGTTCINYAPTTLSQGTPAGGTYSGAGVSGTSFDPSVAGVGTHTITYSYTDGNGCSNTATSDIVVDGCSSVKENSLSALQVFPNPMSHSLTIVLQGTFSYDILDARGRLVQSGAGTDEVQVDTQLFEAGVYFVQVEQDAAQTTLRVVKQ